jgi:hypothetical protein
VGRYNLSGVNEFAVKRPGWPMPIHQLLVREPGLRSLPPGMITSMQNRISMGSSTRKYRSQAIRGSIRPTAQHRIWIRQWHHPWQSRTPAGDGDSGDVAG